MRKTVNIIIAGGKTGGHLFPGIAVAQALERLHSKTRILFIGTDTPFEIKALEKYGYSHKTIISKPIKGRNIITKAFSASLILISLIQAMDMIRSFKPDFILGMGNFSSFAVVLSGWILGIPTAIQEQNAFPGLTNRLLSRVAGTVFTSFNDTIGFKKNAKIQYVGNPVRRTEANKASALIDMESSAANKKILLVTGGSQGAKSINNAFIEALELMENPNAYIVIHQTGISDEILIQEKYNALKIPAKAQAFFHDMPQLQAAADLIIARAGAGTISELCLRSKPLILVPYPYAADDHQTHNAKSLEDKGAAIMITDKELTGGTLKTTIEKLINDEDRCRAMAANLNKLSMPDADEKIARYILSTKDIKR